jgi:hypothetical protein
MNAQQQTCWFQRDAHLALKVRTSVVIGTLGRDHAVAERPARHPFRRAAWRAQVLGGFIEFIAILDQPLDQSRQAARLRRMSRTVPGALRNLHV